MAYKIPFTADTSKFEKGLANMRSKAKNLGNDIEKSANAGSLGFMKTAGAVGGLGVGLALLGKEVLDNTNKVEKYKAMLKTATGSVDAASEAFDRLVKFAEKTPFSLEQSLKAFVTLKNLGLDPSEKAMKSYGDTASAMGKDLTQLIEAVADAATGEFERLKEFGIKSKSEGDRVKFTFRGITTEVGKNSAEIQDYLMKLGEMNFSSSMADQMDTMGGKLNNLGDSWDKLVRRISENGIGQAMKKSIEVGAKAVEGIGLLIGSDKESNIARAQLADDLTFGIFGLMKDHEKDFEKEADADLKKMLEGKNNKSPVGNKKRAAEIQQEANKAHEDKVAEIKNKNISKSEAIQNIKKQAQSGASSLKSSMASIPVSSLQSIGGGGTISGTAMSQLNLLKRHEDLLKRIAENTKPKEGQLSQQSGAIAQ